MKRLLLLLMVVALVFAHPWESSAKEKGHPWEGILNQVEAGELQLVVVVDEGTLPNVPDVLTKSQVVQWLYRGWIMPEDPLTVPDGSVGCHLITVPCGPPGNWCNFCVDGFTEGQRSCVGCDGSHPVR